MHPDVADSDGLKALVALGALHERSSSLGDRVLDAGEAGLTGQRGPSLAIFGQGTLLVKYGPAAIDVCLIVCLR